MSMYSTFWRCLKNQQHLGRHGTKRPPRRSRWKPAFEQLEDRTLPTIIYNPVFGAETLQSKPPTTVMNSATVYLIFWGNWGAGTGQTNPTTPLNEAKAILGSTFLNVVKQYGSDGVATFGGSFVDTANKVPATFTPGNVKGTALTDAQDEIARVINASDLPGPVGTPAVQNAPIYVLITDPGNSNDGNGGTGFNGGYNTSGAVNVPGAKNVNIIGIGTDPNFNNYGDTFSHEMAEKISDPTTGGVLVSGGANLPQNKNFLNDPTKPPSDSSNWGQIGDFEQEPGGQSHYTYLLGGPSGPSVQSTWSNVDQAFVVEDGNSQNFGLAPIWTGITTTTANFSNTYDLTINGDQLANKNDNIVLSIDSAGGVQVKLNGEIANFDPATAFSPGTPLHSITVKGMTGSDTLTVDEGSGTVNVPITFDGGGQGGDQMIVLGDSNGDSLNLTPTGPTTTNVTFGGSPTYSFQNVNRFTFDGGGGDDTMTVDSSTNLLSLPGEIHYDGGPGSNALHLIQPGPGGDTQTMDVYSPGPNPGEGTDVITGPSGKQTVDFQNLAPVLDTVPAMTSTVNGTPANNAINYTAGSVAANGLVTVDNQESYEFSNKTKLVIDGLAGSDTINLNNTLGMPKGLASITVQGDDPTGGGPALGDTLVVNGTTGPDAITVTPNAAESTIDGLPNVGAGSVTFMGIEQLAVNGQGGNDTFTVQAPAAAAVTYNPGSSPDAASVQVNSLVPLTFSNLGAAGSVALNSAGAGGASLIYNGTPADDHFKVDANTGAVTLNSQLLVTPTGFTSLVLNGGDGDDTFDVAGPLPYTTTTLSGGDPSASDVANLTGDGTAAAVNLGATPPTVTGGGLKTVSLPGVEALTLMDGAGDVLVNGTAGPDAFSVTPTGANTASIRVAGINLAVNTNNTGTLTVNPGTGADTVTVNGTAGSDPITVTRGATTAVAIGVPAAFKAVNVASASTEALVIDSGAGIDTVTVNGTGGPASLTVNGGANPRSDTLNVVNANAGMTTVTPGATPDAGTVSAPGAAATPDVVAFTGMASVSVTAAGAAAANAILGIGPNGNDTLFLQHLGAVAPGGTDRFWVNNQAPTTFTGFGAVTLRGLFGNDQFNVNPIGLAAAVAAININGTSDGNSLIVNGSTAADAVTFAPTDAAAGGVNVTTPAGTAPVAFTAVQGVSINGQGGNDTLTVTTPTGADTVIYSSGPAVDAGAALVNNLVPLAFAGLGTTGSVVIGTGGQTNTLQYNGTAGDDSFLVNVPGGIVAADGDVPVTLAGVNTLDMDGQGGHNAAVFDGSAAAQGFVLEPAAGGNGFRLLHTLGAVTNLNGVNIGQVSINTLGAAGSLTVADLSGSGVGQVNLALSPSDAVSLNGTPGSDNVHLAVSAPGVVTATGLPALVNVSGTAAGDSLAVHGGDGNDTIEATPAVSTLIPLAVDGGPGNDTLFAAGNVVGGGGQDTLDLSSIRGPATVNLDSHSAQTVAPGVTLTLVGTLANFNGSQGVDTVTAQPLAQGRVINGGSGADRLNIDAGSTPLYVTGHAVQLVNDAGSITFSQPMQLSFQNVTLADVSSLIVTTHPYDLVHSRVHRFQEFLRSHKQRFQDLLRLENVSGATALYGPMTLAIYGLPPGVLVRSRTGISLRVGPAGSAFIRLNDSDGLLNPGEQLELPLVFSFRQSALRHLRTLTYYVAVFAGNGLP